MQLDFSGLGKITHTDVAAYIGAITGSLALGLAGWQHWKQRQVHLRLETFEGFSGDRKSQHAKLRIEIFNNSPRPITIRKVYPTFFQRRRFSLGWKRISVINEMASDVVSIPHRLEYGSRLIAGIFIDRQHYYRFLDEGRLGVEVYDSARERPRRQFFG
jgi:hypothetical protein